MSTQGVFGAAEKSRHIKTYAGEGARTKVACNSGNSRCDNRHTKRHAVIHYFMDT